MHTNRRRIASAFIRVHSCSFVFQLLLCSAAIAADFTVTDKPAGPPLVGFGVQMNPYLYATPNWPDVEPRVADFEAKVLALRPQHVRIFFRQEWFDGGADNISRGDARVAESFVRACLLAQRAGATINVSHWRGPWPDPGLSGGGDARSPSLPTGREGAIGQKCFRRS